MLQRGVKRYSTVTQQQQLSQKIPECVFGENYLIIQQEHYHLVRKEMYVTGSAFNVSANSIGFFCKELKAILRVATKFPVMNWCQLYIGVQYIKAWN